MKIRKKIYNEINQNIPDVKQSVIEKIDWQQVKKDNENYTTSLQRKPTFWKNMSYALVSFVVACLIVVLPIVLINTPQMSSYYKVTIDVNPTVQFKVDKNNNVIDEKGLNKDGIVLLYRESYIGKNILDTTSSIMGKMESTGIFKTNHNLKLSVVDQNGKKSTEKRNYIESTLQKELAKLDNVLLEDLNEEELQNLEDLYEDNEIELTQYEKDLIIQFKQKFEMKANNQIAYIDDMLTVIQPFGKEDDKTFITDINVLNKIIEYYNTNNRPDIVDIINTNGITSEQVLDLVEILNKQKEELIELKEKLNDLPEDEEDYFDYLEDIYEAHKDLESVFDDIDEELFEEND